MKACYDADRFVARGFRRREFFPHEAIVLRKAYPDTFVQMKKRAVARHAGLRPLQLNLYSNWIDDFPAQLFSDPIVNWHQQQLGRAGLIASAGLFIDGQDLFVSLLQSDLCQQIAKHSQLKETCASRLNNRFRYWYEILFNAILDLALDLGSSRIYSPTAAQIVGTTLKATDPALFRQVYDFCRSRYSATHKDIGDASYWSIDIARNIDKVVVLDRVEEPVISPSSRPVVCLYHDIEENVDTDVAPEQCHQALLRILDIEYQHEVATTYNILGRFFDRKSKPIAARGTHSIAFHTYDHHHRSLDQLPRLREVDLQIQGYRTAQSIVTDELTDDALGFFNFEWLMSSAYSYGFDLPKLENGIVKIPASIDDYQLKTGELTYPRWIERITAIAREQGFVAVGLHDCYASLWIDKYPELLELLKSIGDLKTCDQIKNQVYLSDASTTWLETSEISTSFEEVSSP
jgi:hypothetical protein